MGKIQLYTKIRFLFIGYLLFLFLMAVLPLNSASPTLNHTFVIRIRLDYLLHAILFIPWALLYILYFRPSTFKAKLLLVGSGLLVAFATESPIFRPLQNSFKVIKNHFLSLYVGAIIGWDIYQGDEDILPGISLGASYEF